MIDYLYLYRNRHAITKEISADELKTHLQSFNLYSDEKIQTITESWKLEVNLQDLSVFTFEFYNYYESDYNFFLVLA